MSTPSTATTTGSLHGAQRCNRRASRRWLTVVTRYAVFASLSVAALCPGCSDEASGEATVSAVSYNAGLAHGFVPYAKERRAQVIASIAALDADLVCLQEIWTDDDIAAVEQAAKSKGFSEVYYEKTPEDTAGLAAACTESDTKDLQPCAESKCGDVAPGELSGCVTTKCAAELSAVSADCTVCLASNLGKPLAAILEACATGGATYSYKGYTGLMLLSKRPLSEQKMTLLDAVMVRRGVLSARASVGDDGGYIDVMCTHLTANLSAVKYPGKTGSYESEQAAQVERLIQMATATKGPTFLLGDMNTGPAMAPSISAELPANFARFEAAGFSAPYARPGATCTFCADNTLVSAGADKGGEGAIIDHVMLRADGDAPEGAPTAGPVLATARVLDKKVAVEVGGATVQHHLSDHFGVRVAARVRW